MALIGTFEALKDINEKLGGSNEGLKTKLDVLESIDERLGGVKGDAPCITDSLLQIASVASSGGGGENVEYYKAVIRGDVTYFEGDVESVRDGAFYGCSSLATVKLPYATEVGGGAFGDCELLTHVELPLAETIDEEAFAACHTLTSINLPAATLLGREAFANCETLASISVPNAEFIGSYAFVECASLTSIDLPAASVIAGGAFAGCEALEEVYLGYSSVVSLLGSEVFDGCTNLDAIIVPDSLYSAYLAASQWASYSSYIVSESSPVSGDGGDVPTK